MKLTDILAKLSDSEWIDLRHETNNLAIYDGMKGWLVNSCYFDNDVKAIASYSLDDKSVIVIYIE